MMAAWAPCLEQVNHPSPGFEQPETEDDGNAGCKRKPGDDAERYDDRLEYQGSCAADGVERRSQR